MKKIIVALLLAGGIGGAAWAVGDDRQAVFNNDQRVYNDTDNTRIRARALADKKHQLNALANKKVTDEQDKNKGQVILKF